jgi:formylglycine-generating enzyme required for sulfatase activity
MKKQLLFFLLMLAYSPAYTQDCSSKIQAAQTAKANGNYRLALAQFTAAVSSCGEDRRAEIEKEILSIYDKIERLKNDAVDAQSSAKTESERAKTAEKNAAEALTDARKANRKTKSALDSLNIVLNNLGSANADKVRLILAEVGRSQRELRFEAAVDKIITAKILRALPDSVEIAYKNLTRALLTYTEKDLQRADYKSALSKVKNAEILDILQDDVAATHQKLEDYLFNNAQLDIQKTDYNEAVNKINTVEMLNASPVTVGEVYYDLAFCFSQIGQLERAANLLDTVAHMRKNEGAQMLLRQFYGKDPAQKVQLLHQVGEQLNPTQYKILKTRYFPSNFVPIAWGSLAVGSDGGEIRGTCSVAITPFLMGANEVTFYEYDLFCAATNRKKPADNGWGRGQRPVIDVDWYDAIEYCNWRSLKEGLKEAYTIKESIVQSRDTTVADVRNLAVTCNWSANGYRLPTEVEWEYAAGNGAKHTRFAWGNDAPTAQKGGNVTDDIAKIKFPTWEGFKDYSDGFAYTAPTGSFTPNELGLYDMTGNVWEWCWDKFDDNYCRAAKSRQSPQGFSASADRVLRSGSWGSLPKDCIISNRFHNTPATHNFSIGFRLARNQ